jgi:predicted RNA binding protein YcfA (HicA-like mRNA interferase family)
MTKLPVVSGRQLVKALAKVGYFFDHQEGSHIILRHQSPPHRRLSIPDHKEISRGTLRQIIRESGLRVFDLVHLL